MQANEAIEKLRHVVSLCADSADRKWIYDRCAEALAATATIDPPAAPVLAAVGVKQQQQGNAIRPSAEPAGQRDACFTCGAELGATHAPDCAYIGMVVQGFPGKGGTGERKIVGYGDCKCVLSKYCDGTCNPIWADEAASAPVPRMGGNTSEEKGTVNDYGTIPAAQPAADHAKLIADALELAHDLALEQQAEIAARFEGYKPEKHAAAARDVELAKEALAAWQARGQQAGAAGWETAMREAVAKMAKGYEYGAGYYSEDIFCEGLESAFRLCEINVMED